MQEGERGVDEKGAGVGKEGRERNRGKKGRRELFGWVLS